MARCALAGSPSRCDQLAGCVWEVHMSASFGSGDEPSADDLSGDLFLDVASGDGYGACIAACNASRLTHDACDALPSGCWFDGNACRSRSDVPESCTHAGNWAAGCRLWRTSLECVWSGTQCLSLAEVSTCESSGFAGHDCQASVRSFIALGAWLLEN